MIRHIVFWKHDESFTEVEKENNAAKIKEILESLKAKIPGIVSIEVITDPLPTSDGDIILNSLFENEEALTNYQVNPEHVKAGEFIRSVTRDRKCIDYTQS